MLFEEDYGLQGLGFTVKLGPPGHELLWPKRRLQRHNFGGFGHVQAQTRPICLASILVVGMGHGEAMPTHKPADGRPELAGVLINRRLWSFQATIQRSTHTIACQPHATIATISWQMCTTRGHGNRPFTKEAESQLTENIVMNVSLMCHV